MSGTEGAGEGQQAGETKETKSNEDPSTAPAEDDEDEEDLFKTDDDPEPSTSAGETSTPSEPLETSQAKNETVVETTAEAAAAQVKEESPTGVPVESPAAAAAAADSAGVDITAQIPRNSSASTPAQPESVPSKNKPPPASGGEDAAKYGLPAGVTIPSSVNEKLLQGRLLDTLRALPKQLIEDALTEYDDAVQIKGEAIRNHGAYLFGVIKRYVSVQERATSGEGNGILPMGPELTPNVNIRLQKLVQDGFCTQEEMNEKVKSKIRMLSERDALFAIEELQSVERRQIRNFGSYFMGILNRYMRGEPPKHQKDSNASGIKRQQDIRSPNNRFNDNKRDFHHSGNDPEFRRGRDNDRTPSYRRERSRDRFDPHHQQQQQQGGGWHDQYDPRQAKQPYQHQSPMSGIPGNPPPPPPRSNPAGIPYQQQAYMTPNNAPPPQQQMYAQPPPHVNQQPQSFVQQMGVPPSSSYGQVQQPYSQQQQRHPMMAGAQQQYGPPVGQPPYGSPPGMPPQGGQSYQQHPPDNSRSFHGQNPNRYGSAQQAPQSIPMDILGLADKAASAVQALQSQTKLHMPSPGPGIYQQQHQQPNVYQQQPPPYGQPPPQQYGQPPSQQQGYPGPPPQNYGQPPPRQQQQQQQHMTGPRGGGGGGGTPGAGGAGGAAGRRRTTAILTELPVTVQYAVQNLQATGQINGPLDDGMLGMVKDLPENLALQALEKFSSIDKNTMRNKTAYLAGVLRRELEKIHRR